MTTSEAMQNRVPVAAALLKEIDEWGGQWKPDALLAATQVVVLREISDRLDDITTELHCLNAHFDKYRRERFA